MQRTTKNQVVCVKSFVVKNTSEGKKNKIVNLKKDLMETIVVQPSNDEEMIMLKEFLQQRKIKNRVFNEEAKEDIVLGLLMQETDYNEVVDADEFINQLKGK